MAWNGRFGDDDEGSGLELSLGLPGYFSASPTQAAGAAAFLLLHVLLCLIRNEFHGMALASMNRPLFFCVRLVVSGFEEEASGGSAAAVAARAKGSNGFEAR
jgi:auxin-responsive protein IAA